MSIPRQVEEAARMAEELMASQNPTDDIEETEEEKEELEPEVDEELQPEEESDTEEELDEPDTQVEEPDEEELTFKQKYMSLKGKYDSEVPRLNQELREFKEQVFSRLGDKTAAKEPEPEEKVAALPTEAQEFIAEYGDDYAKGLDAYMAYKLEQMLEGKIQPVQQKVEEFEDTQVKVAQENFATYLDDKVNGDWRALWSGADEGFAGFLGQTVSTPLGDYTNADLLRHYNDNWDADRLATLLNSYLGEPQQEPEPKKKPPVDDSRVAPSRRSAPEPESVGQPKIWTNEMIAEFQTNDRRGMYTPEESQALWDDLLLAPAQNRIRN